jgi:hypothetical protein
VLIEQWKPDIVVHGPMFPEPVQVIRCVRMGASVKLTGRGLHTGLTRDSILSPLQVATLEATPEREPFDGDAKRFRLGIEAVRLGFAYEYDPYLSLSIARVDPLPHQLEAVYDYFLKLPRIRFLLADDPRAGKSIMAGLLLKELKIRGLVRRTLIVTPANLSFQWQREMKDTFREHFEVVRGDVLRASYGLNSRQEKNQVVTSVSWVSRVDDANESLLRSRWDLIIVDEAHRMSAYSHDHKTLAYKLGEALSQMTDHYLLMTATPHKRTRRIPASSSNCWTRTSTAASRVWTRRCGGTTRPSTCDGRRRRWSRFRTRTPGRCARSSPSATCRRCRLT